MDTPNIPGFTLQSLYNKGVKTVTWTAFQQSLGRRVCIHLLRPEFASHPAECEHFLHIARALAKNHSNAFPAIYDVVAAPPLPYVLLEHINDQDLLSWVENKGPLPALQLVHFAQTLAQSFSDLWKNTRFIHRNIKPRNIRLNDRQQPHITAFDLALCAGVPALHDHDDGTIIGTPNYLSPEQITNPDTVDCRTDIYSLGATLYFLVTGFEPFCDLTPEDALNAQLHDQLPYPDNLPRPLGTLLMRMMMKDPEQRYRDWDELLLDLQRIQQKQSIAPLPANALSTIASPDPLPAPKTSKRLSVPSPTSAFYEKPRPRGRGLRFALWLLLSLWFFLLANDRAGDPVGLRGATGLTIPPLVQPLLNTVAGWFAPKARVVANHHATTNAPAENLSSNESQPDENPPVVTSQNPHIPATQNLQPPPPPFSPLRLTGIANALRDNNTADLRILFETPDPDGTPAQLAQARSLYNRLPSDDVLLTTGILQRKNQTITLNHLGTDRQVTLVDAANNTLILLFQADGRRIEIPFAKLAPAECLRLMHFAENTSPEANTALALKALQLHDTATLRRLAPRCGALSPVLQQLAQ